MLCAFRRGDSGILGFDLIHAPRVRRVDAIWLKPLDLATS